MNILPDQDTAMASTSTLPACDSHKTPVVIILRDSRVSRFSRSEAIISCYINPLLKHLGEANQIPRVSVHFIRNPSEHHLTFIPDSHTILLLSGMVPSTVPAPLSRPSPSRCLTHESQPNYLPITKYTKVLRVWSLLMVTLRRSRCLHAVFYPYSGGIYDRRCLMNFRGPQSRAPKKNFHTTYGTSQPVKTTNLPHHTSVSHMSFGTLRGTPSPLNYKT